MRLGPVAIVLPRKNSRALDVAASEQGGIHFVDKRQNNFLVFDAKNMRGQRAGTRSDDVGNFAAGKQLLRPNPTRVDRFQVEIVFFPSRSSTAIHRGT